MFRTAIAEAEDAERHLRDTHITRLIDGAAAVLGSHSETAGARLAKEASSRVADLDKEGSKEEVCHVHRD